MFFRTNFPYLPSTPFAVSQRETWRYKLAQNLYFIEGVCMYCDTTKYVVFAVVWAGFIWHVVAYILSHRCERPKARSPSTIKLAMCHGSMILSADFLGRLKHTQKSWPSLSVVCHLLYSFSLNILLLLPTLSARCSAKLAYLLTQKTFSGICPRISMMIAMMLELC